MGSQNPGGLVPQLCAWDWGGGRAGASRAWQNWTKKPMVLSTEGYPVLLNKHCPKPHSPHLLQLKVLGAHWAPSSAEELAGMETEVWLLPFPSPVPMAEPSWTPKIHPEAIAWARDFLSIPCTGISFSALHYSKRDVGAVAVACPAPASPLPPPAWLSAPSQHRLGLRALCRVGSELDVCPLCVQCQGGVGTTAPCGWGLGPGVARREVRRVAWAGSGQESGAHLHGGAVPQADRALKGSWGP